MIAQVPPIPLVSSQMGRLMRVTVTLEYRFSRLPDGSFWTATTFPYRFWRRYLEVFDEVQIVARARSVESVPESWKQATGPGVLAIPVPYYVGPVEYLKRWRAVARAVESSFSPGDAILLRMSSRIGTILRSESDRRGYPFGVEVVADPYDVFAPGAMRHPMRPLFRYGGYFGLRKACRGAVAAAYVTEEALQRRYPGGDDTYMAGFSDVELSDDLLVAESRVYAEVPRPLRLVMVGGLNQLYKAPHILVDAIGKLPQLLDARLTFIGGGQYIPYLRDRAAALSISDRISFAGELPAGEAIIKALDETDIFVLPSFQEGLPRAMVEAMARGCPCIGSSVGGIPELLSAEDMVTAGDAGALAQKIVEVGSSAARLTTMSARNLARARDYTEEPIRRRRVAFYRELRDRTERFCSQSTANPGEILTHSPVEDGGGVFTGASVAG